MLLLICTVLSAGYLVKKCNYIWWVYLFLNIHVLKCSNMFTFCEYVDVYNTNSVKKETSSEIIFKLL
jgi:hypothetical protein